ncbi:cytochrome C oxidase subunit IV family protein [Motiliproteus sp. MSK22-1]|uniref:cytochrome C oxidase subunit IV family protein n=1 Tax=Motiliproteus sp. MSK22-1 TaxID=1897630 RepID=UPI000978A533|nr:cytochrome C oxidase subunit IV family protein [Motiliproteus sp. MSK22-1]OMH25750.1 hypothetical protein BGP75_24795 [Motiliproteus sp. MSK22-1]
MDNSNLNHAEIEPANSRSAKTLMPSYKVSTILWLLMLALTCASAYFAEQPSLTMNLVMAVLLITAIKAAMIVDYFMNLRGAPRFWRILLMTYVPAVSLVITATFAIDLS